MFPFTEAYNKYGVFVRINDTSFDELLKEWLLMFSFVFKEVLQLHFYCNSLSVNTWHSYIICSERQRNEFICVKIFKGIIIDPNIRHAKLENLKSNSR